MLKKSLSQHLIRDRNITDKMVRLANIKEYDTVVEIGAGYGDLTQSIAEKAKHVYAIEFDKDLIPRLESLAGEYPNITIVHGDFLKISLSQLTISTNVTIIGNIPYKITGPIIFKLLEARDILSGAYLTMQAEVARRIVSKPFNRTYGSISAVCQILCDVKILFTLKPSVFIPPPKVDSAFISMIPKKETRKDRNDLPKFIRMCFQNKRKYLKYALSKTYPEDVIEQIYSFMKFTDTTRAEEIRPDQFEIMYDFVRREGDNR